MCKSLGVLNRTPQEFVDAHRDRAQLSEEDSQLVDECYMLISAKISSASTETIEVPDLEGFLATRARIFTQISGTSWLKSVTGKKVSLADEFLVLEQSSSRWHAAKDGAEISAPINNSIMLTESVAESHTSATALATILRGVAAFGDIPSAGKFNVPVAKEDHVPIVEHMFANIPSAHNWLLQHQNSNEATLNQQNPDLLQRNLSDLHMMLGDWGQVVEHYVECGVVHLIPAWFVEKYAAKIDPDDARAPMLNLLIGEWRKIMITSSSDAERAEKIQTLLAENKLQRSVSDKINNMITLDELLEAVSEFGTLSGQLPHSVPVEVDDRARIVRHMCETQPRAIGWLQGRGAEIVPGANVREFMVNMMSLLLSDWVMVLDSYQMDNMLAHIPRWFIDKYQEQIKPGDSREARIRHVIKSYMGLIDELYEMDDSEVESMDALFTLGQSTKSHDVLSVVQSAAASSAMVATVNRRLEAIAFGKLFCGTR
jgi:hypothetical protein